MRTTLNLDDELMRRLKERASESGRTTTSLIEDAIRRVLSEPRSPRGFELSWVTVRGRLVPGVDVDDRDSLYERMEGRS